jgi:hypothetical protein
MGYDGVDILLEWERRWVEDCGICPRKVKEGIGGLKLIRSEVRKWMQLINIGFRSVRAFVFN